MNKATREYFMNLISRAFQAKLEELDPAFNAEVDKRIKAQIKGDVRLRNLLKMAKAQDNLVSERNKLAEEIIALGDKGNAIAVKVIGVGNNVLTTWTSSDHGNPAYERVMKILRERAAKVVMNQTKVGKRWTELVEARKLVVSHLDLVTSSKQIAEIQAQIKEQMGIDLPELKLPKLDLKLK